MARQCMIQKARRVPKYKSRQVNRCFLCGRGKAYMRKFGLCRICFRTLAHQGVIPGIRKASW